MSLNFGSSACGLALCLPILTRLVSSKTIVLISVSVTVVMWVACAFASAPWQFLAVAGMSTVAGCYFPVLRTCIASCFGPKQFGQSLGGVAVVQQLTQVCAPPVFTTLWAAVVEAETRDSVESGSYLHQCLVLGGLFLVIAGLNLISLTLACLTPNDLAEGASRKTQSEADNSYQAIRS